MAEWERRDGVVARGAIRGGRRGIGRLGALAVLLTLGCAAVAAIGHAPSAGAATDVTVTITATGLDPSVANLEPGASVVWVNGTTEAQTVMASDGSFDSGPIKAGERFQFVFVEPRTVTYEVPGHPGGQGTVVVSLAAVPPPVPGAAPVPAAVDPDLATTGSGTSINGLIGGLTLAFGALLLYSAHQLGWTAAVTGRSALIVDDLLPSRRHRRALRDQSRRGPDRRSSRR